MIHRTACFELKSTFQFRFGLKVNFTVYKLPRPKSFRTKSTIYVKFGWNVQFLGATYSSSQNCVFGPKSTFHVRFGLKSVFFSSTLYELCSLYVIHFLSNLVQMCILRQKQPKRCLLGLEAKFDVSWRNHSFNSIQFLVMKTVFVSQSRHCTLWLKSTFSSCYIFQQRKLCRWTKIYILGPIWLKCAFSSVNILNQPKLCFQPKIDISRFRIKFP